MRILELLVTSDVAPTETRGAIYITKRADSTYLDELLRPTEEHIIDEVGIKLQFPPSLAAFYRQCNGGVLFRASATCLGIVLVGCVPLTQGISREMEAPIDILRWNRGAKTNEISFGSYGADASQIFIDRDDQSIRCSIGRDLSKTRVRWPSLDQWLALEYVGYRVYSLLPVTAVLPAKRCFHKQHWIGHEDITVADPEAIIALLAASVRDPGDLTIYLSTDTPAARIGYRVAEDGNRLAGWRAHWLVTG